MGCAARALGHVIPDGAAIGSCQSDIRRLTWSRQESPCRGPQCEKMGSKKTGIIFLPSKRQLSGTKGCFHAAVSFGNPVSSVAPVDLLGTFIGVVFGPFVVFKIEFENDKAAI